MFFKYRGIVLEIYKTDKGFTVNNIDFYSNIDDLKRACKTLVKKIRGK